MGLISSKPGRALEGGIGVVGDGVADFRVGDILDVGDEESDFAGLQLIDLDRLGSEHAESFRIERGSVPPEANSSAPCAAFLGIRE